MTQNDMQKAEDIEPLELSLLDHMLTQLRDVVAVIWQRSLIYDMYEVKYDAEEYKKLLDTVSDFLYFLRKKIDDLNSDSEFASRLKVGIDETSNFIEKVYNRLYDKMFEIDFEAPDLEVIEDE